MNAQALFSRWLEPFFPALCLLCHRPSAHLLCPLCAPRLQALAPHCPHCSRTGHCCGRHRKHPILDGFFARYRYQDGARELVLRAKFHHQREALRFLGQACLQALPKAFVADAIVPIPATLSRRLSRGYTPTVFLAREVAGALNIPLALGLLGKRQVSPQSQLGSRSARQRNIQGAFFVRRNPPPQVLLIDDVATSLATAEAAARCLKSAGAQVVTLASACAHQGSRVPDGANAAVRRGRR